MHPPVQRVQALSQGESGRGLGMNTALFIAKVKQWVKLYLHSPLSSWQVQGEHYFYFTAIKRISVKIIS